MNNKFEKIIEAQIKKINELENKIQTNHPEAVSVKGNAVTGDKIIAIIDKWGGTFRKPKHEGFEIIEGEIINDSYGSIKGQHTFTILMDGEIKKKIKGRNLYRNNVFCINYNRPSREQELAYKYERAANNEATQAIRGFN